MYYSFVYLARNTLKLSLEQIKTVSELNKNPGQGIFLVRQVRVLQKNRTHILYVFNRMEHGS
jgi:hypothetical protein